MKLLIALVLNAVALLLTSAIVPGFHVNGTKTAILAAIILGLINTFIKPILVMITIPLNMLTLGLFTFVINAVVLYLTSLVVHGVTIESALSALIAAAVLSVISTALSTVVGDIEGLGGKKKARK